MDKDGGLCTCMQMPTEMEVSNSQLEFQVVVSYLIPVLGNFSFLQQRVLLTTEPFLQT